MSIHYFKVSRIEAARRAVMKKHRQSDDILLEIDAKMDRLTVSLATESKNITQLVLAKMYFQMKQYSEHSILNIELTQLQALNLDLKARHKNVWNYNNTEIQYYVAACNIY